MKTLVLIASVLLFTAGVSFAEINGCLLVVERASPELPTMQIAEYAKSAVPGANYSIYQVANNRFFVVCDKYTHHSNISKRRTPRLWNLISWFPCRCSGLPTADEYTAAWFLCPEEQDFKGFLDACADAFPKAIILAINGKAHSISDMAVVLIQREEDARAHSTVPFKILDTNELKRISSNKVPEDTARKLAAPQH